MPGSAFSFIRWATRWASVCVLPVPAPAMMRSGPAGAVAAASWAAFSEGEASGIPEYTPKAYPERSKGSSLSFEP